ncbi:response regulator [Aureimonas leprariae]|uniref:response regulator n=1 Tax=Plantimonas leprariae TaxID=2615207 RepID=UPI0013872171|nr:response regulator [Aureimonas leprariae]
MKAKRVLIVEDELLIALDIEDVLISAGHEVVGVAADMHQAMELAEAFRPDLAIMDVNLARGTNGIETARRLRERLDVPSLFVSGNLDAKTRKVAADCRPLGFVMKPCSYTDLLTRIAASA